MNPTLEYLNLAIALVAFLISNDLSVTVANIREYFRRNPNPLGVRFEQPQELALLNLIIDKGLLDRLTDKVKDAIDDETNCIKNAKTGQEMDGCARKAEKAVCDSLNYIRDRNNEDLPTDYLNDSWSSYRCVRYVGG